LGRKGRQRRYLLMYRAVFKCGDKRYLSLSFVVPVRPDTLVPMVLLICLTVVLAGISAITSAEKLNDCSVSNMLPRSLAP